MLIRAKTREQEFEIQSKFLFHTHIHVKQSHHQIPLIWQFSRHNNKYNINILIPPQRLFSLYSIFVRLLH